MPQDDPLSRTHTRRGDLVKVFQLQSGGRLYVPFILTWQVNAIQKRHRDR